MEVVRGILPGTTFAGAAGSRFPAAQLFPERHATAKRR